MTVKEIKGLQAEGKRIQPIKTSSNSNLAMVWKRSVQGEVCYRGGYEYLFNKLPDCIILFHSVQIHYHHKGTVVIAPYTYFFTVAVKISDANNESHQSNSTNKSSAMKLIQIEVVGCKVNYYNIDNKIVRQAEHIALKSCSDPSLSTADIILLVYPQ
jgi:hypothetical protein